MVTDLGRRQFQFVAGDVSLDFVNTVSGLRPQHSGDFLTSYDLLLQWAEQAGIATGSQTETLRQQAAKEPHNAEAVLNRALSMREHLHELFAARLTGQPPSRSAVDGFNSGLSEALGHSCIEVTDCKCDCTWDDDTDLNFVWWPVAKQAAALLTSDSLGRLRECGASTCGWLYLDLTKNRSRKWCIMSDCGNRAKVRRHREKHRQAFSNKG